MKNILLSAAVAVVLGLGGCGSDNTTTTPVTTSKALDSVKSITRPADATYVAAWVKDADIELSIAGGVDASKFEIENKTTESILKFKNDITPEYVEGAANEYIVEINAKDVVKNITKKVGTFKVKVPKPTATNDTEAPVITTSKLNMKVGETKTITANEPATFTLQTQSDGFSLTPAGILTAPNTAGDYTISITATDSAKNTSNAKNIDVNVTAEPITGSQFSTIEDSRATWLEANNSCAKMAPVGTWELPTIDQIQANSDAVLAAASSIDSDGNSSTGVHFTSVIWSISKAADSDTGDARHWGMNYSVTPVDTGAFEDSINYYFTCIKK